MKKSISALACASLLALTLSATSFTASAQTTPQFDSPAAAAPKPVKKKAQAKPRAKAKAKAQAKAKASSKAKASGKTSARKKARKPKKAKAL
ncbi:MAG: hypothetical protein FD135_1232 [Comamonadaceae bacterium]|nr:MAG: hypothetical protein FD135_1232 [Comamonadaceae bacterium]